MMVSAEDGVEHVLFALLLFIRTPFASGWSSVLPHLPAEPCLRDKGLAGHGAPGDALLSWEMPLGKISCAKARWAWS